MARRRIRRKARRTRRTRFRFGPAALIALLGLAGAASLPPVRSVAGEAWHALLHRAEARRFAERYGVAPELAAAIVHAARTEGVDPDLAFRLVRVESGFRERAVSPVGALGLTQLMPATARELQPGISREQIFEPDTNLRLGFRYLHWLLERYDGDVEEALHAYNRGPGTVARVRAAGRDPANGYARRILDAHDRVEPYQGQGFLPRALRF